MRLALGIEYDGSGFSGWQRLTQPGETGLATVQSAVEGALSTVADRPVLVTCAGRTDAGAHHVLIRLVFQIIGLVGISHDKLITLAFNAGRPLLE